MSVQTITSTTGAQNIRNRPYPRHREGNRTSGPRTRIADITGPFAKLQDRTHVLVIADVENIAYGGRDLGMFVDFAKLADCLRFSLNNSALHAVFSAPENDGRAAEFLSASGWQAHQRNIVGRHANADAAIAFQSAVLLARTNADACIIATGDGGLALDVAQGIRNAFTSCSLVATLSLAASTSRFVDTRNTKHIDVNLEIGRDVMRFANLPEPHPDDVPSQALTS